VHYNVFFLVAKELDADGETGHQQRSFSWNDLPTLTGGKHPKELTALCI